MSLTPKQEELLRKLVAAGKEGISRNALSKSENLSGTILWRYHNMTVEKFVAYKGRFLHITAAGRKALEGK